MAIAAIALNRNSQRWPEYQELQLLSCGDGGGDGDSPMINNRSATRSCRISLRNRFLSIVYREPSQNRPQQIHARFRFKAARRSPITRGKRASVSGKGELFPEGIFARFSRTKCFEQTSFSTERNPR